MQTNTTLCNPNAALLLLLSPHPLLLLHPLHLLLPLLLVPADLLQAPALLLLLLLLLMLLLLEGSPVVLPAAPRAAVTARQQQFCISREFCEKVKVYVCSKFSAAV
jgi:hypothetical protein